MLISFFLQILKNSASCFGLKSTRHFPLYINPFERIINPFERIIISFERIINPFELIFNSFERIIISFEQIIYLLERISGGIFFFYNVPIGTP